MTEGRVATEVDERLGERVRARRMEIGMSQERLAELLGVTFQQVQKYEKGVNRIAASRLLGIAIALDTPPGRFYDGLDGKRRAKSEQSTDHLLGTPGAADLLRLYSAIDSEKVRLRVVELVRAMATDK